MTNFVLNFLSGINVIVGFVFYLVIGKLWGLSDNLDLYFAMYVLLNYLGHFVQIFWEGFSPFYAEIKVNSGKEEADKLFSALLNRSILVSTVLVFILVILYPIIAKIYFKGKIQSFAFYLMFLPFLLFQNLFFLMKAYLQINFSFKMSYILDILSNLMPLIFVVACKKFIGIFALILGVNLGFLLAGFMGLMYSFKKLNFNYHLTMKHETLREILKGSVWLKMGAFAYGAKDIIINNLLLGMGEGIVSAYSYASKFVSAVHLVVNAPAIMKFANKVMYMSAKDEYKKIKIYAYKVSLFLILLFGSLGSLVYFFIPLLLKSFWNISPNKIELVLHIYLFLFFFYLIISFESPFARLLAAFKKFSLGFAAAVVFIVVFFFFLAIFTYKISLNFILFSLLFSQFCTATFYLLIVNYILKRKIYEAVRLLE